MIRKKGNEEHDLKEVHQPEGEHEDNATVEKESAAGEDTDSAAPKNKSDKPVKSANEQIAELNDKYLRLYSEFDNYRKRTLKERIELSKTASMEIIEKLLPVLDDFERAIKAFTANSEATEALKDGIILIFNKFLSTLNQQGLEQMKSIGESFDTDFHEAITNIPAASPDQRGKIVDEIQKGYLLNGKVIRFAKVVVGS